jgi:hypothetical protein
MPRPPAECSECRSAAEDSERPGTIAVMANVRRAVGASGKGGAVRLVPLEAMPRPPAPLQRHGRRLTMVGALFIGLVSEAGTPRQRHEHDARRAAVAIVGELADGDRAGTLHLGTLPGLLRTYSVPYWTIARATNALNY